MTNTIHTGYRCLPVLLCAFLVACPSGGTDVRPDGERSGQTVEPQEAATARQQFDRAVALWQAVPPADPAQVEQYLERAVDADPTLVRAWFNLGVVREARNDREGAIEAYRQSNAVDPTYMDGLANYAAMLLEEGQEAEAERILLDVVEAQQFHPSANLNLANLHRKRAKQGDFINRDEADQAINHIRMSLAGDSMNVDAYETLAAVYFDLQQTSLARLVCLNAITLGLDSADLHNRLGLIALAEDDVTSAYAQFRQAAALDPEHVDSLMNLGAIALNYRDYQGAFQAFDAALTLDRDNTEITMSRAVALRGMEDFAGAEQAYQAILALEPQNLDVIYNLAILYQEYIQDYEQALEWYQTYQRLDAAGRTPLAPDVETRIDVTRQLIQIRQLYGDQPAVTGEDGDIEELEAEPPAETTDGSAAPLE